MRFLTFALAATCLLAPPSFASPANPANGAEYLTLQRAQDVQTNGKRVEVIEFFMYHCPACYALEPALAAWVKKQGDKILFRRIHIPHIPDKDPEAHLFLTLEAMGLADSMHDKVLATWHVEHLRLKDDNDNLNWALKNGIDKARFLDAYNSFGTMTKLRNLLRVSANYQVDSTPTLVVAGHYLSNPALVNTANPRLPQQEVLNATLQVLDALVAKAAKEAP
ncbi:MAG: thiol:disulfide interchange protein DsbA/DsbL [Pseudomonadota bacterium]